MPAEAWSQGDEVQEEEATTARGAGTSTTDPESVTGRRQPRIPQQYPDSYFSAAQASGVELRPMLGVVEFRDARGQRDARGSIGVGVQYNFADQLGLDASMWSTTLESGFQYSHLGDPDSGFLGTEDTAFARGHSGANLLMIPLNAKVGINPTRDLRLSVHGGGNIFYRSEVASIALNENPDPDQNWDILPNVGVDVDYALSDTIALALRPDWSIAEDESVFNGTLALGISL